jgi:hypothetical protein
VRVGGDDEDSDARTGVFVGGGAFVCTFVTVGARVGAAAGVGTVVDVGIEVAIGASGVLVGARVGVVGGRVEVAGARVAVGDFGFPSPGSSARVPGCSASDIWLDNVRLVRDRTSPKVIALTRMALRTLTVDPAD